MSIAHKMPLAAAAIATPMAVGVAITAFGLWQQDWPEVLPGGGYGHLGFIGGCALILWFGARWLRLGYAAVTALLGIAIVLLAEGLWALLAVAAYLGASLCLGTMLLNRLCGRHAAIGDPQRILVGACLYATVVGFGVHFSVNYSWAYLAMLAVPMVAARGYLAMTLRAVFQRLRERVNHGYDGLERALLGALVLLYLAMAFLPELSHDPLAMHLFVPAYVAANKAWSFDPELYVWTFMPMLADWSYTIGYVLAGEAAARLVNLGFLLLSACFVREFVLVLGGSRRGADWATLLLLSMPVTLLVGSSLYVESFWSASLVAGALWLFRAVYDAKSHSAGMLNAGIALGSAVAAKAVVLVYVPLLALPVLHRWRVLGSGAFLVALFKGAAAFLILGAWPYVLAYVETGNPVFPFYNSFFESPLYPPVDFNNVLFDAELTWQLPYLLIFASEQFIEGRIGSAGFQWFALGVPVCAALFVLRVKRAGLLLAVALFSLLVVFQFQAYLRYVFPVLLLLCALLGLGISRCGAHYRMLGAIMVGIAGLTVLINLLFLGAATPRYPDVPVLDAFRPEKLDRLVSRRVPVRKAVALVNAVNEQRAPVAFLAEPAAAGLDSPALFANWYNRDFMMELRTAEESASFAEVLSRHRGRYLIFDAHHRDNQERFGGLVAETGDLLGQFGPVAVYKLQDEAFFSRELIERPNQFEAPSWRLSKGIEFLASGAIAVTLVDNALQEVAVREGDFYWQRVTAKCHNQAGLGRVQVNWADQSGKFIKTDIRVFECGRDWSVVGQEVVAPAGAVTARVFGVAHGGVPIQIAGVSFRGAVGDP